MTDRTKLKERARDELFSHINRCGVLKAEADDQKHWMDETMEYLGERYPDLTDAELKELYTVGLRFCQPAIAHVSKVEDAPALEVDEGTEAVDEAEPIAVSA